MGKAWEWIGLAGVLAPGGGGGGVGCGGGGRKGGGWGRFGPRGGEGGWSDAVRPPNPCCHDAAGRLSSGRYWINALWIFHGGHTNELATSPPRARALLGGP